MSRRHCSCRVEERMHAANDRRVLTRPYTRKCHDPRRLFEARRLLALETNLPRRVNEAGVYSSEACFEGNTVHNNSTTVILTMSRSPQATAGPICC